MAYNITSPARRRNIRKVMDILNAEPAVSDDQILAAHAKGMEVREEGGQLTDNRYVYRALREAFAEGWYAADRQLSEKE